MKKKILFKKVIFTIFIILILRIGNYIPIANVDQRYLSNLISSNSSLKFFFNTKNLIINVMKLHNFFWLLRVINSVSMH